MQEAQSTLKWDKGFNLIRNDMKYRADVPLSATEECLSSGFSTPDCPSSSTISRAAIDSTLVNKDQLVWVISSNTGCKMGPLFSTSLDCNLRKLICNYCQPYNEQYGNINLSRTFFMVYPPFLSARQIVDSDTVTPWVSSSSCRSSSRYKSGVLLRVLNRC